MSTDIYILIMLWCYFVFGLNFGSQLFDFMIYSFCFLKLFNIKLSALYSEFSLLLFYIDNISIKKFFLSNDV